MNNNIIDILTSLGFTKMLDNLYSLTLQNQNFATELTQIFVYEENEKFFICDNGDLVEEFDCVNVDLDKALQEIENILTGFNCYLNESKIV